MGTMRRMYLFSLCPPDYSPRVEGHLGRLRVSQFSWRLQYLPRADCGPHGTAWAG